MCGARQTRLLKKKKVCNQKMRGITIKVRSLSLPPAAILQIYMEDVMAKSNARESKEKLIEDFHSVISDPEELMRSVSSESGGKAQVLRDKIEQNLKHAKEYLQDFEESVVDKSRVAARMTDEYVHENAWRTVGLAIGLGVVIGLLLRNRD